MDFGQVALALVPIPILLGVFGLTYAIGQLWTVRYGASPSWINVVPFFLGGAIGTGHYFLLTTPESLAQQTWWFHLGTALIMGLGYGGGELLVWIKIAKKQYGGEATDTPVETGNPG